MIARRQPEGELVPFHGLGLWIARPSGRVALLDGAAVRLLQEAAGGELRNPQLLRLLSDLARLGREREPAEGPPPAGDPVLAGTFAPHSLPVRLEIRKSPRLAALVEAVLRPGRTDAPARRGYTAAPRHGRGYAVWDCSGAVERLRTVVLARSELLRLMVLASLSRPPAAVLHGTAVADGEEALLFCGRSGSGKSTLAAALLLRGHRLVADDYAPLAEPDTGLEPVRLAFGLKRTSPLLAPLGRRFARHARLRLRGREVHYFTVPVAGRALPVRHLIFPLFDPGVEPQAISLNPAEALRLCVAGGGWYRGTRRSVERWLAWLESVPATALLYPDTESALALLDRVRRRAA